MRRPLLLFALAALLAAPAPAALVIDPGQSTLTPTVGGVETLSGDLQVALGAAPPLVANTTFDVVSLNATSSGGLDITLDPSLSNPAAGVLNPAGGFLIPNLFLELDDGVTLFQLTVPNVTGSYGDFTGCPGSVCLETTFDIDTGGAPGIVTVHLFAVPEPGTALLLWLGLAALGVRTRIRQEGSR